MAFEFEIDVPTEHELQVAEKCNEKIVATEIKLAWLNNNKPSSVDDPDNTAWRVDAEMVQSELEFWRGKKARVVGSYSRHEGRGGYWLVPFEPSARALRLANGLTDLADISASPRDINRTLSEIGLAVRIAIEADGIPVMHPPGVTTATEAIDVDARLDERKDILVELDNTRADLIKLAARYLEFRKGVEGRSVRESNEARYLVEREHELDKYFGVASLTGPLEASISAWRGVLGKART
jgi:hypothetical protein